MSQWPRKLQCISLKIKQYFCVALVVQYIQRLQDVYSNFGRKQKSGKNTRARVDRRGHAREGRKSASLACAHVFCPFLCLLPKRDHLQSNTYSVHYGIFVTKCHTFQQHQHVTFDLSLKQTQYHKFLLEFSTTIEKFL